MHVYDNRSKMRYELSDGDELAAFVDYRVRDGRFWLPHTEILGRYQGTDAGSMLVRGALDDLRRRGVLVVPTCPYVAGWIRHHPEYDDLVDHETWREYKRSRGAGRRRATGSPTSTSRGTTPAHATMGAAGS